MAKNIHVHIHDSEPKFGQPLSRRQGPPFPETWEMIKLMGQLFSNIKPLHQHQYTTEGKSKVVRIEALLMQARDLLDKVDRTQI